MDDQSKKADPPSDRGETQPETTSRVPFDEKMTASEQNDVQARVEAAVESVQTEVEKRTGDPLLGSLVGDRFQVTSRIGTGGMGVVYKARQAGMDRWVAVKVLLKELTHDEKVIKRFKIEALAASRLTHPNTIRIYDFGITHEDVLYIAMEFLDGTSLERALHRESPMSTRRTLHILKQIGSSLVEAHEKGIVHRDLKPDNIFLTHVDGDQDFVKVLDFGVAKLREADKTQGTLTQAGVIFGTPRYMAPEQCRSVAVDQRADLYAMGVIGYECLTGSAPFDAESPLSILIQHVQEAPKPLPSMRPDIEVPEDVESLVMRCLEKKPDRRFDNAKELVAEVNRLEAKLAGRYERVVFVSGPRKVTAPGREASEAKTSMDTVDVADGLDHPAPQPARKWPWIIGSVVVLGLVLGGFFVMKPQGEPPVVPALITPSTDSGEPAHDAWEAAEPDEGVMDTVPADLPPADAWRDDGKPREAAADRSYGKKSSRKKRKEQPLRRVAEPPPAEPVKKKDKAPSKIGDLKNTPY